MKSLPICLRVADSKEFGADTVWGTSGWAVVKDIPARLLNDGLLRSIYDISNMTEWPLMAGSRLTRRIKIIR